MNVLGDWQFVVCGSTPFSYIFLELAFYPCFYLCVVIEL